jgi:aromatic-L-amino-acid/L-tryptophan decarboxylase
MRPDALAQQMARDRQAGLKSRFVSATAGTASSNGLDPLLERGRIFHKQGGATWTG